ncbi:AMP-binding protein, partial [Acidimicrobiaceae bacterium USS-CC1]|nr:AMP-binding protein [Acidiferrimicrobium australe]
MPPSRRPPTAGSSGPTSSSGARTPGCPPAPTASTSARSCSPSTRRAASRRGWRRPSRASTASPSRSTTSTWPDTLRTVSGGRFNASEYLLDRRLDAGDADRLALTGVGGELTYAALHDLVGRTAAGLRRLGLLPEQRIVLFMADGPEFAAVYLGALRMGAIPVPVSTMLRADGLSELLVDSRARLLAVSAEFAGVAAAAVTAAPELAGVVAGTGASVDAA